MKTATIVKNWTTSTELNLLENIHREDINITIYDRDVSALEKDINKLVKQGITFKSYGSISTIMNEITKVVPPNEFQRVLEDIKNLLGSFKRVTRKDNFRLLFATINTNMCRRFHTDVNNLRMLCTYAGQGTLWLTDDNVDRKALKAFGNNESIVLDKNNIQQIKTGNVVILKGAVYPNKKTKAVVHRSPTIEENGEKRLLLRIDTN